MYYSTSDYGLDGEIWTIRLYKRSTYSNSPKQDGEYVFDIEFRDICWDSVLEPPYFRQSPYVFDLWQFQRVVFAEMQDTTLGNGFCGGITSELLYISGPQYDATHPQGADLFMYDRRQLDADNFVYEGSMDYRQWLGTHYFQIKSRLGVPSNAAEPRGDGGLYGTAYSEVVPLTIIDPCKNSTVNADDGFFLENFFVPTLRSEHTVNYDGPTDFISDVYGNGYDKCGPRRYSFYDDFGEPFTDR